MDYKSIIELSVYRTTKVLIFIKQGFNVSINITKYVHYVLKYPVTQTNNSTTFQNFQ